MRVHCLNIIKSIFREGYFPISDRMQTDMELVRASCVSINRTIICFKKLISSNKTYHQGVFKMRKICNMILYYAFCMVVLPKE